MRSSSLAMTLGERAQQRPLRIGFEGALVEGRRDVDCGVDVVVVTGRGVAHDSVDLELAPHDLQRQRAPDLVTGGDREGGEVEVRCRGRIRAGVAP